MASGGRAAWISEDVLLGPIDPRDDCTSLTPIFSRWRESIGPSGFIYFVPFVLVVVQLS